jgi:hypothetical protein
MCGAAKGYLLVFTAAGWAAETGAALVVSWNLPGGVGVLAAGAAGGESQSAAWPAAARSIAE